jgi:hypothetical protein
MKFPTAALNQHVAVLGKTGSGKTFAVKGLAEWLLEQKRQVCVLDPTGAWWGLRLGADGKSRGFDVVLLGGKHADIPLAERSGPAVARLVTEQGASIVVDTSGFSVGEYTRWFTEFAGTLYTTIRNPLHLIIDEAHYFAPQGKAPDPQAGKMIHACNRLMSGGRSLGIRGMLITQRPAKLHKDSLTCADTLVAMRVIAPQDRQAIKDWIDGAGDPAQGKQILDSLAGLARGEGWVWYPEGGILERMKFPAIKTYDSSATPTHGAKAGPKVGEIKLDEVKAALSEAVKEAEANDPAFLRKQITDLKSQLGKQPKAAPDSAAIDSALRRAMAEERAQHSRELAERDRIIRDLSGRMGKGESLATQLAGMLHANGDATPKLVVTKPLENRPKIAAKPLPQREMTRSTSGDQIGGGLRRILVALAQRPGLTNRQIGIRAALSSKSGTFSTYLSKARSNGWIRDESDRRFITDEGLAALGPYEPLPSGQDLLNHWLSDLGSSGAGRILRALADNYPHGMSNEEIGEAAEISHASGTFSTYMSKLRSLELIQGGRGNVKASEELFDA